MHFILWEKEDSMDNNRNEELKKMLDEIPPMPDTMEIEEIRARFKARKSRKYKFAVMRNTAIGMAACFAAFVTAVNMSPAFMAKASELPLIGRLADIVCYNKGYQDAIENDLSVEVGQVRETSMMKLELERAMADSRNIVLFFKMTDIKEEYKDNDYSLEVEKIVDSDTGKNVQSLFGVCNVTDYNGGKYFVSETSVDGWDYSTHITVTVKLTDDTTNESDTVVYQVELPEEKEPVVKEFNREYTVRNQKFTICSVTLYPTRTIIRVKYDKNNTMEFRSVSFSMISENGKEYKNNTNGLYASYQEDGIVEYVIAGGYYDYSEAMALKIDSVELLPYDMIDVTFDSKTGKFYDANGEISGITGYKEEGDDDTLYYILDEFERTSFFESYIDAHGELHYGKLLYTGQQYEKGMACPYPVEYFDDGTAKLKRGLPEYVEKIDDEIKFY